MEKRLRILLLEDFHSDAELIKYEIHKGGLEFDSVLVQTKDEFISAVNNFKPDIILSDYSLPQFDGMSALRAVKQIDPSIPFVLVTGSINEETAVECMKAGADDYVIKEHLKRLVPAILGALQNKAVKLEKENAQKALRESEERFRGLVESMNDIVFLMDHNYCITNVYGQWFSNKHVSPELFLNKNISQVFEPSEIKTHTEAIRKTFQGEHVIYECTLRNNPDIYILQVSTSPVFNQSHGMINVMGVARDITKNKYAELELVKAKDRAQESDRLKSVFLAQISHEIRTPLNTIISYINLIKDDLAPILPEDMKGSFSIINKGVQRLIRTIDLLLNMSQIQTGYFETHPQALDINKDILRPVIQELSTGAKLKAIELKLKLNTDDLAVTCDSYSVVQIFLNLIENSVKFTPQGEVYVNVYRNNNQKLCVEVKDTGIGISREYMQHLFTPFSQEEMGYTRRFEGNGLGLALVKKYCELNNASVLVESQKGKGSTFTVIFN